MKQALDIKNLHKKYANNLYALNDVSLSIQQGDFFALLGPNGAGKSTLINCIASLVKYNTGQINIFGYDSKKQIQLARQNLGVMPQEFNFDVFQTVQSIILNQAGFYGISRKQAYPYLEFLLKAVDLWEKRNSVARALSGGMKRRLMIARSLIHKPKLLILDEPTAGVDIENRRGMWDFLQDINSTGTTIILTTHYLEEAEQLCRNIAIIDSGKIIERSSMKSLLNKLDIETIIFELAEPYPDIIAPKELEIKILDEHSIELTFSKQYPLNMIFEFLQKNNIQITSMRNKHNRLEELFLRITTKQDIS